MGREDTRNYFAQAIRELHQRRQFVDIDEIPHMELYHEAREVDPSHAQEPNTSKLFEGLEQCLSWHQGVRAFVSHGYTWLRAKLLQEEYPSEGYHEYKNRSTRSGRVAYTCT